jgi:hypothetical protein
VCDRGAFDNMTWRSASVDDGGGCALISDYES